MDYGVIGNTTVFGAVILGSNPSNPTTNLYIKFESTICQREKSIKLQKDFGIRILIKNLGRLM